MHRFVGTSESAVDCGGSIKPVFSPTRFKDIAPVADVVIDRLSDLFCEWSRLDWSSGSDDLDIDTVTLDKPAILPCSCFRPSKVCLLESDSTDSLSDDLFLSASATFARADSFGGRLGERLEIDACAASSLNARSLSLSSRRADGLDFLASPRPFDANIPLSPDFGILGLSRPRLRSVTPELVFGEPEALDEPLFDNGFPPIPPVVVAVIPAPLPVFVVPEEMVDFIPAANIIFVGSIFCAACNVCGFFDAGPEFTPGLRPVCVFGEPLLPIITLLDDEEATDDKELEDEVAAIDPDDDNFKLAACLESLVRVLLMVIFIPSELCFTIYSAGFFVSTDAFLVTQDFPPSPIVFPPLDDDEPPPPIFFSFCPALLIPPVPLRPEDPLPFTLLPPFPQTSVSLPLLLPLPLVKLFITAGKERPSQIFSSIRMVNGMLRQRCSTLPLRSDVCSAFVVILTPYNRHLSVDMSVKSSSAVAIVSSYGCSTLTLMCCHERALTSSIVVCSGSWRAIGRTQLAIRQLNSACCRRYTKICGTCAGCVNGILHTSTPSIFLFSVMK
ncbi:hypothetical protein ALC62_10301 [Cyphomyrmex costatus]|uniref:Uncharacterized protein n=1 Tax=Cyphomyrmex costatus TaxID=456900 RepID=A0A151IE98_9HYME|nr:hypothetical protein ALC62_10301 [Cyphomyrmex costatus]